MSSHRTNSSLCPLATFFSAPSGLEERKTAMISAGSTGAGPRLHCKSILSFAGTRHQAPTSNENITNDEHFMGLLDLEPWTTWPGASLFRERSRAAGNQINAFPRTARPDHGHCAFRGCSESKNGLGSPPEMCGTPAR